MFEIFPTTDNACVGVEVPMPSLLVTTIFVEVIEVPLAVVNVKLPPILVVPKFEAPETYKLVLVTFTKKALVEVIMVPLAVVKISPPDNVPPVKSR